MARERYVFLASPHPAWRETLAERQREMVSQWEEKRTPAPSLVPTGFGIVPSATDGSSHGTMTPELKVEVEVRLAASRQAFEAVARIFR